MTADRLIYVTANKIVTLGRNADLHVTSYNLIIDLDFANLTFQGKAFIDLESEGNVTTLNSLGLKILGVRSGERNFSFKLIEDDLVIETGRFKGALEIEYGGSVLNSLVGIYKAPYGNKHIVTTQFEAANARTMFPCVDRPDCKATFTLSLIIDTDLDAISNMPIESVNVRGKKKTVTFQKTPRMSTYLLYLGVGKFSEKRDRLGKIDVIVATTAGMAERGKFAIEVTKRAIGFFESYYAIPYALPKIHLIAVPEFSAGAMENWGAITFRETALLVDENSSVKTKKRVAEVVTHELAHQWFGNLVTMKWWDDLWLNESFATFMASKVVDALHPQWKVWHDFLRTQTSGAMARDSLRNTHPIEVGIKSPLEIEEAFDAISYGKGGSILRMIEAYVGAAPFRDGIRNFLSTYKFTNATGNDLWNSLQKISGKKLETILSSWIRKPGYPIIMVTENGAKLRLRQERFLLSGEHEKDIWPIPITLEVDGKPKNLLFDTEEMELDLKATKSLKVNVDRTGFYRVEYETALHDPVWRSTLSPIDRWGIISDALAFFVSGRISLNEYLKLAERFYEERGYLPTLEVSDELSFLYAIMPSKVAEVSREFHRSQLVNLEGKRDENSTMMRGTIATRLAIVDEEYAQRLGAQFQHYEKVEPDMREAVSVAYARASGDFDLILKKYKGSTSDEERVRLLISMTSFKEASLSQRSLELALTGEVKRQDVATMVYAATGNPDAREAAWRWVRENITWVRKLYEGTGHVSRMMLSVIPIQGIGIAHEVRKFFEDHNISEAGKGIEAGLEKLEIYDRLVKSVS